MQARLGQLFPRLDVLAVAARLQLSELLAREGGSPALLADEIAELPLPTDDGARGAMRTVIGSGLVPQALAQVAALRLAEVVPPISGCEAGLIAACPTRLGETLRRREVTTWSKLGDLTLGEIGDWTNVGRLTLATLVGLAVEVGLDVLVEPSATTVDGLDGGGGVGAALAVLVDHERATVDGGLLAALEHHATGHNPAAVRNAAARLLTAADQSTNPYLDLLDRVWNDVGDHRDRLVLDRRVLRLTDRCPTKELAQALGISGSRVGQLEVKAVERARHAGAHGPRALREMADAVRQQLGPVSTHRAVGELLAARRLPAVPDPRSLLLLWLAGPYFGVPGHPTWLATDPVGVLADTSRLLREDGGVRPSDQVATELGAAGIAAAHVEAWLAEQPVVLVDGLVVARNGTPADVAERLLSATGRAMTAAQLSTEAGANANRDALAGLESRLLGDRRFVRVSRDHFELAEWGSEAWSDPAATELELVPPGRPPKGAKAWLRIEIDQAALSGSSAPVPLPLVEDLGVAPGARRTFATRFGPVALSHKAAQPVRGSVRPVALAAGAGAGDVLLLGFDAIDGNATVELVDASFAAT